MFDQTWLDNLSIQTLKYRELSEVCSKKDPETSPYSSKYEARKIMKDLLSDAEEQINATDIDEDGDSSECSSQQEDDAVNIWPVIPALLFAAIEYDLGCNYIETEEVSSGEEHLQNCLDYLARVKTKRSLAVTLLLAVKGQLGILWSNRTDHEKAVEYFQEAERDYDQYQKDIGIAPLYYRDILLHPEERTAKSAKEREDEFEKQHTLTLYYLAQAYSNLGESAKAARYCHITLLRQKETSQYEPADWALNCATMSQYYLTKDMYTFSRYCLACASEVAIEAEAKFNPESFEEDELERVRDKISKVKADVARCWAKYCLNLLIYSHTRMLEQADAIREGRQDEIEQHTDQNLSDNDDDNDDLKHLKFKDLEVTSLEEQVADKSANSYETARELFLTGQKWLDTAKEFYVFDGYVTDSIEISQDMSQLYKYLAIFDDSFDRRCKMQKKRIDLLNAPLVELNPQHFLQVCRQLTFEIGDIYGEMADLKKAIMEQDVGRVSAESIKKYNKMLLQSIRYYQSFIDSYKNKNEMPTSFEDDAIRGVLLAYFYLARLHSKYLTPDRDRKTEHLREEQRMYEFIVNYCDTHPEMPNVFEAELDVSREMLALFPAKMNKLLDS
eukprot:gene13830-15275_t